MEKEKDLESFLKDYEIEKEKYEKPSVTTDIAVFKIGSEQVDNYRKNNKKTLDVLLIKRNNHPYKDKWALPGGFIQIDEDIYTSALRELKEETNVENIYMEQLYTLGEVNRDPRMRIISVSYLALISDFKEVMAGDDASEAEWFSVEMELLEETKSLMTKKEATISQHMKISLVNDNIELSSEIIVNHRIINGVADYEVEILNENDLAFDHAKIIYMALGRIKNKLYYTDVAFQLLPETFTLREAQDVFEVILGEKLYASNFRRKVEEMLIETDMMSEAGKGHRPAKLYKYNPFWDFN